MPIKVERGSDFPKERLEESSMAEAAEAKKSGGGGGGAKIAMFGFIALNLIINGGGLALVYMGTLGWNPPQITEEEAFKELTTELDEGMEHPLIYTMDKFTANLNGQPKRSIRLEINLEMLGQDGFEEVLTNDNKARARDSIVRILNDKTFSDLESIQGKLFLKDQIAVALNSILQKGVIKDIYFTDFVVQ